MQTPIHSLKSLKRSVLAFSLFYLLSLNTSAQMYDHQEQIKLDIAIDQLLKGREVTLTCEVRDFDTELLMVLSRTSVRLYSKITPSEEFSYATMTHEQFEIDTPEFFQQGFRHRLPWAYTLKTFNQSELRNTRVQIIIDVAEALGLRQDQLTQMTVYDLQQIPLSEKQSAEDLATLRLVTVEGDNRKYTLIFNDPLYILCL